MNYLLLICSDGIPTPEKASVVGGGIETWVSDNTARDILKCGHRLASADTAKTVRRRDGETLVSDGPFAESKEFVAGFEIIDAADLDEALAVAAAHPVAQFHAIEVRPFVELKAPSDEFPLFRKDSEIPSAERLQTVPDGKTRYALFVCVNGIAESDEQEAQIVRDAHAWLQQLNERDAQVFGRPLAHADTATTVRVRNEETLLSDGPFVEAKEFIAGVSVVDCESEAEAIAVAAQHPIASYHRVEVRAFADDND